MFTQIMIYGSACSVALPPTHLLVKYWMYFQNLGNILEYLWCILNPLNFEGIDYLEIGGSQLSTCKLLHMITWIYQKIEVSQESNLTGGHWYNKI